MATVSTEPNRGCACDGFFCLLLSAKVARRGGRPRSCAVTLLAHRSHNWMAFGHARSEIIDSLRAKALPELPASWSEITASGIGDSFSTWIAISPPLDCALSPYTEQRMPRQQISQGPRQSTQHLVRCPCDFLRRVFDPNQPLAKLKLFAMEYPSSPNRNIPRPTGCSMTNKLLIGMVARVGIEPTTRGFSVV
jgi:hypothetical protein